MISKLENPGDSGDLRDLRNPEDQTDPELIEEKNQQLCDLIKYYIEDFYDNIYIPYNHFKDNSWNIIDTININEDVLYYNEQFLNEEDKEKFYEIFDKFTTLLTDVMTPDNAVHECFNELPDIRRIKSKKNTSDYILYSLLTSGKYQYISPAYIIQLFNRYSDKLEGDDLLSKIKYRLDNIINKLTIEAHRFKKIYFNIISSYVYEKPISNENNGSNESDNDPHVNPYTKGLINSILLEIIEFANKLIKLHIYAIHAIVNKITNNYLLFDDLNTYDLDANDGRILCIV